MALAFSKDPDAVAYIQWCSKAPRHCTTWSHACVCVWKFWQLFYFLRLDHWSVWENKKLTDFALAFFSETSCNKSRANQSVCSGQVLYMLRKYEAEQVSEAHIGRHVPRAQRCDACLSGLSRVKSVVLICKGSINFTQGYARVVVHGSWVRAFTL